MKLSRIAARSAFGRLVVLAVLASLLVAGCGQRRAYYNTGYNAPPVVVVHHYGFGVPPVVHVHHYGSGYGGYNGYGYGGGQTVIHVHHYGGYGGGPIVVHHYHR